ncbi:hypothetical protein ASE30_26465 [Achromobacter sp. Root83]|uniref:DUF4135 domain-containing protein n=1 Tax=Achromobacter sp. Root83 TaxID=1736602 RepID=UPI00070D1992|nr:DUF4135 domain-containing protein [Achromobacter sp. Root83]KRC78640.1 hypothetical protein ASE30_26465 [Achromobacter sp. Root83]
MTIGLGSFASFARANPDADRVVIDGNTLKNDSQNTVKGALTWFFSGSIAQSAAKQVEDDNRDAVQAFQDALASRYGNTGRDAGAGLDQTEALSASRITRIVNDAGADTRAAARDAAKLAPDIPVSDKALNAVMDAVKLPPGPHARLVALELRQSLQQLHNPLARFDATPDASLLPALGGQLGERLEECVTRALTGLMLRGVVQGRDDPLIGVSVNPVLNGYPNGLEDLCAAVPGLRAQLDAEKTAFNRNVTTLLGRLDRDVNAVAGRFFGGADVRAGLQGMTITSSDPHKGGNRVVILDFGDDRKAVYKPRDVRIDEALSGAALSSGHPSMMEIAGADALTYRFLPLQDAGHAPLPGHDAWPADATESGHYGYVEFLPNGEPGQCVATDAQAKEYYGLLGRGVAAMMLAGAADLHHENIMVSGQKPYFSDLEFALTPSVHTKLAGLMEETDTAAIKDQFALLMGNMALHEGMTKATDSNGLKPEYSIDAAGAFQRTRRLDDVTESLLVVKDNGRLLDTHGALKGPELTRTDSDGSVVKYRQTLNMRYSAQFAQGLEQGLIAAGGRLADYRTFLADASHLHVRIHPINTTLQRSFLSNFFEDAYTAASEDAARTAAQGVALRQGIKQQLGLASTAHMAPLDERERTQRADAMMDTMLAAYRDHDVPYFSRRMDDTRLFFNGDSPVSWGDGAPQTAFFGLSDAERVAVLDKLEALGADGIELLGARLGGAAKTWLEAETPIDGGSLGRVVAEPKTVRMLETLGAKPSDFVQMDEPY